MAKINIQYHDLQNTIPYTMLQATMSNKKEYKVVLFNRVPKYIAHNPYSIGTVFSKYPHNDIMSFAANALNEFSLIYRNSWQDSEQIGNARQVHYLSQRDLSHQ